MRNMTPSTSPHAMLHPIIPTSSVRTSSRPAVATLSVPVNVSAMITPNRISEVRASGSRTRSRRSIRSVAAVRLSLTTCIDCSRAGGYRHLAGFERPFCRCRGEQMHRARDDSRPSGLMAGAEPGAVVAVEVFVKQQQVAPVRVLLELCRRAVDRPAAIRVPREDAGQPSRNLLGNLIQRHLPA